MPHRLDRREGDVPITADVLVLQHDGRRDLIAGDVVEAVARIPRTGVGADVGALRRRQVGIDVVDAVDVAVIHEFRGAGKAAGQAAVDGDVAAPYLREAEVVIGNVELVAGCRRAGHVGGLVLVDVSRERERGGVVRLHVALQHAGVAELIRNPDVERLAGKHAGAAAQLRLLIPADVVVEPEARRPQEVGARHLAAVVLNRLAVLVAERQPIGVGVVIRGVLE